jgi:ATP-dependent RNA helicase SUPV3L1/SUV3
LSKARPASDHWTLQILANDAEMRAAASAPAAVRLLWQACQLPDFRKLTPDEHAHLVGQIFRHLTSDEGVLPDDWMARQIARLDVTDGEVDTLSGRLAQIRTWTYAAHKQGWTRDPSHWQEVTRAVEDRLSDALHERLTQRFIDRRTAILMRHLRDEERLELTLDDSGAVSLGSEHVGKLEGFRFAPDPRAEGVHGRTLRAAALKGLAGEMVARARALGEAPDGAITLSEHGRLWWAGAPVAKLTAGPHPLTPVVELFADELLKSDLRGTVQARLEAWVAQHIAQVLEPLVALRNAVERRTSADDETGLLGASRGLGFQLAENLGQLPRDANSNSPDMRTAANGLKRFGVRLGRHSIFMPLLMKPASSSLAALLWAIHAKVDKIPSPPAPGLTSFGLDKDSSMPDGFLAASFYRRVGRRAVRLDILERVDDCLAAAARLSREAEETLQEPISLLGCSAEEAAAIVKALGWRQQTQPIPDSDRPASRSVWQRTRPGKSRAPRPAKAARPDSPFAGLAALIPVD